MCKLCSIGWKCANINSLSGTTHTCRRNNNKTSIFSYLFNVTVILPKTIDQPTGKMLYRLLNKMILNNNLYRIYFIL